MTKLRHILVTGAAGFIGGNFARIALENNYCVTGLRQPHLCGPALDN